MDDALLVRLRERGGHALHDVKHLAGGKRSVLANRLGEISAFEQLHRLSSSSCRR